MVGRYSKDMRVGFKTGMGTWGPTGAVNWWYR